MLLKVTSHPNLLPLVGVCASFEHQLVAASAVKKEALVFPWCEHGSLLDFIKLNSTLVTNLLARLAALGLI